MSARPASLPALALRQRAWSALLRNVVLPLGDRLWGQRLMQRLRFLEEAQWWPRERLHAERDRLLAEVVRVSYHEVPFYRALFDEAGVRPEAIRTPTDLVRLPVVTKAMLRAGYPDRTTRDTGQHTHEVTTSGSTGTNFCVREDADTGAWYRASFMLALEWAGWRIGERHLQTGIRTDRDFARRLKDAVLRCHYVSAYDLSDDNLDVALDLLDRRRIAHLWGYPGSLAFIARRAAQRGWNRPLRSAVTWGDNLYPDYRAAIERVFGVKVIDTYGCGEGIQISAQCGHDMTYHVHVLDTIVEYVDERGLPVPAGQPGNLVLTRLHAGPMPLIRYRVGDVGVSGGDRTCTCGRQSDVMECIEGRATDVILTPSGNRLIVHFFTGIMADYTEIAAYQAYQEERESMTLRLVPTERLTREVTDRLVAELRRKGADLRIDIEIVPEIPLPPTGKRRFVISKLTQR